MRSFHISPNKRLEVQASQSPAEEILNSSFFLATLLHRAHASSSWSRCRRLRSAVQVRLCNNSQKKSSTTGGALIFQSSRASTSPTEPAKKAFIGRGRQPSRQNHTTTARGIDLRHPPTGNRCDLLDRFSRWDVGEHDFNN